MFIFHGLIKSSWECIFWHNYTLIYVYLWLHNIFSKLNNLRKLLTSHLRITYIEKEKIKQHEESGKEEAESVSTVSYERQKGTVKEIQLKNKMELNQSEGDEKTRGNEKSGHSKQRKHKKGWGNREGDTQEKAKDG